MFPEISLRTTRRLSIPVGVAVAGALVCWFIVNAFATPFDHDESQYIAGAWFSGHLLIFRDFLYLQPPLHAWTFAPIAELFPANMVLAMRLATAALALATLGLLYAAQRIAGIRRDSATIACLMIGATSAFQFCAGVVRNDMLGAAFTAAGLTLALAALRDCRARHWFAPGLCFGLAIATKLSFAPVALAMGLYVLTSGTRCGRQAALWLAAGGLCGIAPMLLAAERAPEGFVYGVFTYGATAPFAWYAANGAGGELTLPEKLSDLLRHMATGPTLAALLILVTNWWMTRGRVRSPGRRLAIWTVAGGLLASAMPTPTQLQYLMPLLPSLILALGYFLDDARHWRPALREGVLGLLCLTAVAGLAKTSLQFDRMMQTGSPVLDAARDARWAAIMIRRLTGDDEVATLSPHLLLGSGLVIDPRFAPGPFAYRTGWLLPPAQARALRVMTPATLTDMDRAPPEAILTGYEGGTRKLPSDVDRGLDLYAQTRGYTMLAMPDGKGRFWYRRTRR